MGTEPWVEDESHRTINGERWVARECCDCDRLPAPECEFHSFSNCAIFKCPAPCTSSTRKDGRSVRWYRSDSPALAFFDNQKDEPKPVTDPVRPLSEICMDGIQSSLRTLFQDRDRREIEAWRDTQAASLDARVQAAMDATMAVVDGVEMPAPVPAPAPEDDVEIIIDPTPEQVPAGGAWGCWWDVEPIMLDQIGLVPKIPDKAARVIRNLAWAHFAIIVRGYLGPCDFVARVRKMLAEKETEK